MDAKDILGLPKTSLAITEKKSRPQKDSQRKPDGISREVSDILIPPSFMFISHLFRRIGV